MTAANQARALAAEREFRARLAELGAELLEPYKGADKSHRVRCAAGHEGRPRPADVRRGDGICRICARCSPVAAEAAFRARLAALGAVLLEPYKNARSPHRVRCAAGHDCAPWPGAVQRGQGICRVCAGSDPAAAEAAFRARLAELGAVLLEPQWLGNGTPHRARCAAGHECMPRPDSVRQGRGICRVCARMDPAAAEAAFRTRLAELGAMMLEPAWLGSGTRHRVRCAAGHECLALPDSVKQGSGICRFCVGQTWDTFYVVATDPLERIKFGITSGDPRPRLAVHRRYGYREHVRLLTDLPGDIAPEIERAALAALRLAEIKPVRGREYYDGSALALVLDVADNYPITRVTARSA